MTAVDVPSRPRRSLLTNPTLRSVIYQALLCVAVGLLVYAAIGNAADNLARARIATGFGFWNTTAGFDISQTLIERRAADRPHSGSAHTLLVGAGHRLGDRARFAIASRGCQLAGGGWQPAQDDPQSAAAAATAVLAQRRAKTLPDYARQLSWPAAFFNIAVHAAQTSCRTARQR